MGLDRNVMVNKEFFDALMHRTIDLNKFSGSFNFIVSSYITDLEHSITSKLISEPWDVYTDRCTKLKNEKQFLDFIDPAIQKSFFEIERKYYEDATIIANQENYYIHSLLSNIHADNKPPLLPISIHESIRQSSIAGKSFQYWLGNIRRGFKRELLNRIRGKFSQGTRAEDVVKFIKGDRQNGFKNGLFQKTSGKTQTLLRSGFLSATNEIRKQHYFNNAHFVKSIHWHSTLDGKSSGICSHSDHSSWEIPSFRPEGDSNPYRGGLPHFNCRSTFVPIFKSDVTIQDSPRLSIREWINERSEDERRGIFGERKFSLFQKAKISHPQLINFRSTPISIDEMLRRYEHKGTHLRSH